MLWLAPDVSENVSQKGDRGSQTRPNDRHVFRRYAKYVNKGNKQKRDTDFVLFLSFNYRGGYA